MHHKRKNTSSRHWMRRADMKSYRQQEARALDNLDGRASPSPRSDSWSYRPEPLPLGDVACNGKVHGRTKKKHKKERCPVNGTHEWYRETVTERDWYPTYRWCQECFDKYGIRTWGCATHSEKRWYTETREIKTCIHCWKVKTVDRRLDFDGHGTDRSRYGFRRNLVLKKRPIDTVSGMTLR